MQPLTDCRLVMYICLVKSGEDFYGPYDAQEMGQKHAEELGVEVVPSGMRRTDHVGLT